MLAIKSYSSEYRSLHPERMSWQKHKSNSSFWLQFKFLETKLKRWRRISKNVRLPNRWRDHKARNRGSIQKNKCMCCWMYPQVTRHSMLTLWWAPTARSWITRMPWPSPMTVTSQKMQKASSVHSSRTGLHTKNTFKLQIRYSTCFQHWSFTYQGLNKSMLTQNTLYLCCHLSLGRCG